MIEVPGLKKRARDGSPLAAYQYDGMEYLARAKRSFLCDDVGLGKTVQALGAIRFLDAFPAVIACPGFARPGWMRELAWWLPDVTAQRLEPGAKVLPPQSERHALVVGFDSLDGEVLGQIAGTLRPKAVAVDESHYCKNHGTKRTKAVKQLSKGAYVVYCMTATPIENKPAEFAPQLEILRREHDVGGKYGTWTYLQRYCVPPGSRVWRGDFSFGPIGDLKVGDEVIGWGRAPSGRRRLQRARVDAVMRRVAPIVMLGMASGRIVRCTPDHKWLSASHGGASGRDIFVEPDVGKKLRRWIEPTPVLTDPEKLRDAYWLGGMYDGEGTGWRIAQSASANPVLHEEIDAALKRLGFATTKDHDGVRIRGGRQAMVDFLNWTKPRKRGRWTDRFVIGDRYGYGYKGGTASAFDDDEVVSMEPDGWSEVVALTTATGNYVVEGYASKNCNPRGFGIPAGNNPATGKKYFDFDGANDLADLLKRMKGGGFFLRRKKADVQKQLPEKRTVILPLRIENRAEYDAAAKDVVAWKLANEGRESADRAFNAEALVKLEVLKQLAVAGKWRQAVEWIQGVVDSGEKLVVFTSHVDSLKRLVGLFPGGVALGLGGDSSLDEREAVVQAFQHDPKVKLVVANLRAGGVAIDLTASSIVAFMELGWTASAHEQAEGRVHRQGQRRATTAYYLLAQNTVEEDVHALIEKKRRMMAEALDGAMPGDAAAPVWIDALWQVGQKARGAA